MPGPEPPLFSEAREAIARLGADLQEMAALRWQLARLELEAAAGALKRVAVVWAASAVAAIIGLALSAVCLSELLGTITAMEPVYWLLILSVVLLSGAALAGWLAWRRFQRQFVGFEETVEELREDLVWLRDWADRSRDSE